MRNQQYDKIASQGNFSPNRESLSLKVGDIQGASPTRQYASKKTMHYNDRLATNYEPFQSKLKLQEVNYGQGSYNETANEPKSPGKKHYTVHYASEIAQYNVLAGNEIAPRHLHDVEFPRNLSTTDIPGAIPGSLQNKSLKSNQLASLLRENSPKRPTSLAEDSLDKFNRETKLRQASALNATHSALYDNESKPGYFFGQTQTHSLSPERQRSSLHANKSALYLQDSSIYRPNFHNSISQNNSPLKRVPYGGEEEEDQYGKPPSQGFFSQQNQGFSQQNQGFSQQNQGFSQQGQGYGQYPEEKTTLPPIDQYQSQPQEESNPFGSQQIKHMRIKSDSTDPLGDNARQFNKKRFHGKIISGHDGSTKIVGEEDEGSLERKSVQHYLKLSGAYQ